MPRPGQDPKTMITARDEAIILHCCRLAKDLLQQQSIDLRGNHAVSRLCVSEPHMHKKGVLFTSLVMSLAIAEILDIEYIWTSDSDSIVFPETIHQTMCTMAGDANAGGASTSLYIHNANHTAVTQLGNAVYLTELYLARSFFGATGANDCQSGPCAAFRAVAMPRILLKWYKQSFMGHWMV